MSNHGQQHLYKYIGPLVLARAASKLFVQVSPHPQKISHTLLRMRINVFD